jgi:predicted nucleotidyltransferase
MSTMHIRGRIIAGIPALVVRKALRSARNHDAFTHRFLAEECKISERKARELVKELLRDNFLQSVARPRWDRRSRMQWYKTTDEGFRFSNASGLNRMPRVKAEQMLTSFLKRVEEVNANPEYIYSVSTVIVSGSYARGDSTLGDLDIFYGLEPRFGESDRERVRQERINLAFERGRTFSNIVDELYWPEHEIGLHLKARTRGLSLHSVEEFFKMKKDAGFAYKVLIGDQENISNRLATPPS